MLKKTLLAGAAATVLIGLPVATMPAFAQNTPTATTPSSTSIKSDTLIGHSVVNNQNEKIGDVTSVYIGKNGQIDSVIVGVGGFLGIGKKDVAFPFSELTFVDEPPRMAAAPAAGVTAPANPNAPASTGSTATSTTTTENDGVPDRATVKMTKADLQSAPEFYYSARSATSATTNTAPPASRTMPPAAKP